MNLREQLLKLRPATRPVTIEGVGDVHVREWSEAEFEALFEAISLANKSDGPTNAMARYVVSGVCDADGNLLFAADDLEAVTRMPLQVVKKLFEAVCVHNGIDDDETEDLVGNSETTTQSGSGTD